MNSTFIDAALIANRELNELRERLVKLAETPGVSLGALNRMAAVEESCRRCGDTIKRHALDIAGMMAAGAAGANVRTPDEK